MFDGVEGKKTQLRRICDYLITMKMGNGIGDTATPHPPKKNIPFNQTVEPTLDEIKLFEALWEIQSSKKFIAYRHSTNRNVTIHI